MQINVSQQLKSSIGTVRNYEVDTTVTIDDQSAEFTGTVLLMKTDRGLLLKGTFNSNLSLRCGRCLSNFPYSLKVKIEEEYFPIMDVNTGVMLPAPEDPGSFTIDDHNIMDISEAIRQYTLMALPIKPLCRQDCSGLCPTCGMNLNENKCECTPEIDPRWEKLSTLVVTDIEYSTDK
ncbi:MAG: DUF177 domain-containing protein [Dehalococcoidales bacterium]|nr:MAG: DUF177 domain-containing protein [Dehalococcoidales bacterium]